MYFADHFPPHFHAEYGEKEALIAIEQTRVIAGDLPSRALSLVREWVAIHRRELASLWDDARHFRPLGKIDPLP
jgi:hypothetical protein